MPHFRRYARRGAMPPKANGSSGLNFQYRGKGTESPELGADPPIIPRSRQEITPIRLTGAEMRALLAKKKDQRGRYELCQMVNWTLKCLARRPSLATSRLPNRGSRAWKIAERRPGGRLAFLCRRQSRESSHACRIAQSGNRLPPAAWCRRGLQAA